MRAPQSYNYSNSSEFPTNSEFKFRGQFPRETESVERAPAVSMESCSPANTASAHLYMKRKLQTKRVERAQRAQIVEPIVKNHAPPPLPFLASASTKKNSALPELRFLQEGWRVPHLDHVHYRRL
jgi:hypothetical protein